MATQRIGIIMHGVTGRMGYNQHLVRSVKAIMEDGGILLSNGDSLLPDPILVGRNAKKWKLWRLNKALHGGRTISQRAWPTRTTPSFLMQEQHR